MRPQSIFAKASREELDNGDWITNEAFFNSGDRGPLTHSTIDSPSYKTVWGSFAKELWDMTRHGKIKYSTASWTIKMTTDFVSFIANFANPGETFPYIKLWHAMDGVIPCIFMCMYEKARKGREKDRIKAVGALLFWAWSQMRVPPTSHQIELLKEAVELHVDGKRGNVMEELKQIVKAVKGGNSLADFIPAGTVECVKKMCHLGELTVDRYLKYAEKVIRSADWTPLFSA